MIGYIIARLLLLPPLLLAVSFVIFILIRATPGDPAIAIAGEKAPREVLDRIRAERGFDKPVLTQYAIYVGRLLRGDLGVSYKRTGQTVAGEILRRLPPTIELTVAAMILAIAGGLLFGILAAVYKSTWVDYLAMGIALTGVSVPIFWLGLLLLIALGGVFAGGGSLSVEYTVEAATGFLLVDTLLAGRLDMFMDALRHLVLPAVALATIPMAMTARITRAAMLEVLSSDFVKTARAKGLPGPVVLLRHGLRNALIPILTLAGLEFGYLLGGAVLTETVFDWPGMGTYILRAVRDTEYDSIGGAILVLATVFVLVNLTVDLLYAFLDPRIRYGSAKD